MNDFESTVRENLESFDDVDLVRKIKSGNLTDAAREIAESILKERAAGKTDEYLKAVEEKAHAEDETENEINEIQKIKVRKRLKLMNAIGVAIWGLGVTSLIVGFIFSFVSAASIYASLAYIPILIFTIIIFFVPYQSWKVCHYENNIEFYPSAQKLNLAAIIFVITAAIPSIYFKPGSIASWFGIAFWIATPSLINLNYLPKIILADSDLK